MLVQLDQLLPQNFLLLRFACLSHKPNALRHLRQTFDKARCRQKRAKLLFLNIRHVWIGRLLLLFYVDVGEWVEDHVLGGDLKVL